MVRQLNEKIYKEGIIMARTNANENTEDTHISKLRAATKEFNEALRASVKEKLEEIGEGAQLYRFDFEKANKEEMIEKEKLDKEAPDDCIEYFWIEYDGKKKKWAFFYCDVDKGTHNVHVIPGLFEKYEHKEDHDNKPYVEVLNGKAVIKNVRLRYSSFAEIDDNGNGWWVPISDCIPLKKDYTFDKTNAEGFGTIDNLKETFGNYFTCAINAANCYKNAALEVKVEELSEKEITMRSSYARANRYKPLRWYNIYFDGNLYFCNKRHFMDLFNLLYFENYGFFIQYNCVNFTEGENEFIKGEKRGIYDIIANCPIIRTESDYEKYKAIPLNMDSKQDKESFKRFKERFEEFLNQNLK